MTYGRSQLLANVTGRCNTRNPISDDDNILSHVEIISLNIRGVSELECGIEDMYSNGKMSTHFCVIPLHLTGISDENK